MASKWQPHKRRITELYLDPENTLDKVRSIMERDHDFFASKTQYERHLAMWNVRKNQRFKADHLKWLKINFAVRERREKDQLAVYINNQQIPMEDVLKSANRCYVPTLDLIKYQRSQTPPPGLVVLKPVSEQYMRSIKSRELPCEQFRRQVDMDRNLIDLINIPYPMMRTMLPVVWPENTQVVSVLFRLLPPEKQDYTSTHLKKIFGNDHGVATNEFLKLAVHLLSNKFLRWHGAHIFSTELLKWIETGRNINFLRSIMSCQTPTIEAFMEVIFSSTLLFGSHTIIKVFLDAGINPNIFMELDFQWGRDDQRLCTGGKFRPLQLAVDQGDRELVMMLLDHGADIDSHNEWTNQGPLSNPTQYQSPLQIAARKGNLALVDILIHGGAAINLPSHNGPSALQNACLAGNLEIGKLLLENGANTNAHNGEYGCPLECAIRQGADPLIKLLLEYGADINCQPGDRGNTPLQSAAMIGDHQLVKRLLRLGADPNSAAARRNGKTALQWAARNGDFEMCKRLVDAGANVNGAPSLKGWRRRGSEVRGKAQTALVAGIESGCLQVVEFLLERNADVNDRSGDKTALEQACMLNNTEVFHMLLTAGADLKLDSSIAIAIEQQNFELMERLMAGEADFSGIPFTRDPLCSAIRTGNEGLVQQLLERGFSPNRHEDEDGFKVELEDGFKAELSRSPIGEAVNLLDFRMVNILLRASADINPSRYDQYDDEYQDWSHGAARMSPLQRACRIGNLEMARHLLHHGADVNWPACEENGMTALQAAVASGSTELVKFLLMQEEIDPNAPGLIGNLKGRDFGENALQMAVALGNDDLIRMLLASGARANDAAGRRWGKTSLQHASYAGNDNIVQLLLDHGADVNADAAPFWGFTALQAACYSGQYSTVHLLLKNGAEVNAPVCKERGYTALQAAAWGGYLRIAQLLIDNGAVVDSPGSENYGRTALEAAAFWGRIDMLKLLLNAGADINKTEFGRRQLKRALELATGGGHDAVAKFLKYHQIA